ncbi:penicillin-binding protein, partial [Staphylococcus pseudintermedius]
DNDAPNSLQNRIYIGGYDKTEDQMVGSIIVDSQTGAVVASSGGRNNTDVVDRNESTDARPTVSSSRPFSAYVPPMDNMQWTTNHAIQDEPASNNHGPTVR